jgi:septal ring factor EnvC (AmiA/AmiB activator)
MKTTLLMTLVCALAIIPASANPNATLASQLTTEARELASQAGTLAKQLKQKNADISPAREQVGEFTRRAGEINRLVGEIESSGLALAGRRAQEFDRLKSLASLLNLFVGNKQQLIESGDAARQRELLRSHIVGIATRADLIDRTVRKLGI